MQSLLFFFLTVATVVCLIVYLWVYTEIDETLLVIEIQNSTSKELMNELQELKRNYTNPETLLIIVDKRHLVVNDKNI